MHEVHFFALGAQVESRMANEIFWKLCPMKMIDFLISRFDNKKARLILKKWRGKI